MDEIYPGQIRFWLHDRKMFMVVELESVSIPYSLSPPEPVWSIMSDDGIPLTGWFNHLLVSESRAL